MKKLLFLLVFFPGVAFAGITVNGGTTPVSLASTSVSMTIAFTSDRAALYTPSGGWIGWNDITPNSLSLNQWCAASGGCVGLEGDGAYWVLWVNTNTDACGSGTTRSACKASGDYKGQEVELDVSSATPSVSTSTATSSVDQTQRNVWQAWWTFFAMAVLVIWLGRSTKT